MSTEENVVVLPERWGDVRRRVMARGDTACGTCDRRGESATDNSEDPQL